MSGRKFLNEGHSQRILNPWGIPLYFFLLSTPSPEHFSGKIRLMNNQCNLKILKVAWSLKGIYEGGREGRECCWEAWFSFSASLFFIQIQCTWTSRHFKLHLQHIFFLLWSLFQNQWETQKPPDSTQDLTKLLCVRSNV